MFCIVISVLRVLHAWHKELNGDDVSQLTTRSSCGGNVSSAEFLLIVP